ncbi:serine hydrolase domain-containing protein [Tepidicaulis sp. LMO-SS28]|uniref:serine hydrolase domain-containing protein n=1 Tax=Tepidicaulis sp. LMO-SS28 TaxID=3447455 RepID=UPI003EE0DD17
MHPASAFRPLCFALALLVCTALAARAEPVPLPFQPEGLDWPTAAWPEARPPAELKALIARTITEQEDPHLKGVRALLVIREGRLIGEGYRAGFSTETRFPSWSMAKSVTHALTGILMQAGKLDIGAKAPAPEWRRLVNDPRAAIRTEDLLRMQSGLTFIEDYEDPSESHALQMLFGTGRHDMGRYAASLPLAHEPGTHWSYSSGTSNILARLIKEKSGAEDAEAMNAFMQKELFRPIGIESAVPEFDASGSFIGSSFVHMRARDWARFGYLYLRDGKWEETRILPEGWADHARTPARHSNGKYGAHFWLNAPDPETGTPAMSDRLPADLFMARGFGGQALAIIPSKDMVIVMLGTVYEKDVSPLVDLMADMIEAAQRPAS